MKNRICLFTLLIIGTLVNAQTPKTTTKVVKTVKTTAAPKPVNPFKNQLDSVSYIIGQQIGADFKKNDLGNVNINLLTKGMKDAIAGKPSIIDPNAAATLMQNFFAARQPKQDPNNPQQNNSMNAEKGKLFLAENAKRPEVKTTPSGLQYEVLTLGTGEKPLASNTVKVKYLGTTIDGKVFDGNMDAEPITFPLNGVIRGWTEGLQLMPVGSKYKFFIPSDLAYGSQGAGGVIAPDETLIFEVVLLAIEK